MEGNVVINESCKRHPHQKKPRACRSQGCCAHQKKWRNRKQQYHHPQQQHQQWGRYGRGRSNCPDLGALLRPVNLNGKRAPGMRAPKNTTQFLMHEKYQELKRQAAAQCPKYWEGDSMLDYLSYFEYSRGSFEQANTESLKQAMGPPERHKIPIYGWLFTLARLLQSTAMNNGCEPADCP